MSELRSSTRREGERGDIPRFPTPAGEKDARAADDDEGRKEENSAKMLLELLAVLAATCAVLYYRFRRKCTYWYAIINKYMLGSKNPFL